ncbi:SH3 domain-containing protein [Chromobacterium sp. LK1]|uniref:SH3 domain-containing protein n=1 Tax=Chromobacterium sp. LK1 TaxID=1628193 RepID=UPI000A915203|nr:SH3 domain-containing protein [Chromobacterium sp. LK1]
MTMTFETYIAIQNHTPEHSAPISFAKGAPLLVGERYEGPEGWENWYFCETPGQAAGGWVPGQLIEYIDGKALARDSYSAQELDIQAGERLLGSKTLNGWLWCRRQDGEAFGWVPLNILRLQ